MEPHSESLYKRKKDVSESLPKSKKLMTLDAASIHSETEKEQAYVWPEVPLYTEQQHCSDHPETDRNKTLMTLDAASVHSITEVTKSNRDQAALPPYLWTGGATFRQQKNYATKGSHPPPTEDDLAQARQIVRRPFSCSTCEQRFPKLGYLRSHLTKAHPDRPSSQSDLLLPYHCQYCDDIRFEHEGEFWSHQTLHLGESAPFRCRNCGVHFTTVYGRRRHLQMDCRERNFVCELCGKQLVSSDDLTFHISFHSIENRSTSCLICDLGFAKESHLKTHMKVHQ